MKLSEEDLITVVYCEVDDIITDVTQNRDLGIRHWELGIRER